MTRRFVVAMGILILMALSVSRCVSETSLPHPVPQVPNRSAAERRPYLPPEDLRAAEAYSAGSMVQFRTVEVLPQPVMAGERVRISARVEAEGKPLNEATVRVSGQQQSGSRFLADARTEGPLSPGGYALTYTFPAAGQWLITLTAERPDAGGPTATTVSVPVSVPGLPPNVIQDFQLPALSASAEQLYVMDWGNAGGSGAFTGWSSPPGVVTIDPTTREVLDQAGLGLTPTGVASPDGARLYLNPCQPEGASCVRHLVVVDTASGKVVRDIVVGDLRLEAISADGRWLYLTPTVQGEAPAGSRLTRFDTEALRLLPSPIESACPVGEVVPSHDGAWLYVLCEPSGPQVVAAVKFIDLSRRTVAISLELPGEGWATAGMYNIVLAPDGRRLYAVNGAAKTVTLIDATSQEIVKTVVFSREETASLTQRLISRLRGLVVSTAEAKGGPWRPIRGVAISSDGSRLYIAGMDVENFQGDGLWVVETGKLNLIARIGVDRWFNALAVSPDGSRLYALSQQERSITVIDTATNSEIAEIRDAGRNPAELILVARVFGVRSYQSQR